MQKRRWSLLFPALVLSPLAILAVLPPSAAADTRAVNCGAGRHIASALRLPAGSRLTIVVSGTCNENVVIDRDDVTLAAGPSGGTINGTDPTQPTILADGVKGVVVDGLHVTGANHGIVAKNAAEVTVRNAAVTNNAQGGIVAIFNSTLTVDASTVQNNGATGNPQVSRNGILVSDSSAGTVTNSTITGNATNGISASRASSVRIGRTSAAVDGPNEIASNGSSGISIYQSSQGVVWGNHIHDNSGTGIYVEGGTATIVLNDIESNHGSGITVTNSGGARIGYDDTTTAQRRSDCPLAVFAGTASVNCTNKVRLNGNHGIEISNGANANLYGNLIEQNSVTGVSISNASARSAGNNTIRANGGSGIQVARSFFQQAALSPLAPSREFITGNGTAKMDEPGNDYGVLVNDGGQARMMNFEISGNRRDGIQVAFAASAELRSEDPTQVSLVTNNGTAGPGAGDPALGTGPAPYSSIGSGIAVGGGAFAEVRGITVSNNKVNGVLLSNNASAQIRAHVLDNGNGATITTTISGNAASGVNVLNGSSVDISKNTLITGNGITVVYASGGTNYTARSGNGLNLSNNSTANVTDSTITLSALHGVAVANNSTLNIGASSSLFPPIGNYPAGLVSVVSNNGIDGITVSGNSIANLNANTSTSPYGASAVVQVAGNKRNGLACLSSARLFGNVSGVAGNVTDPSIWNSPTSPGADLFGTVLTNITVGNGSGGTTTAIGPMSLTSSNFSSGPCQ